MERRDTENVGCWERFLQTGSVADYLSYTASAREPEQEKESFREQERNDRTS